MEPIENQIRVKVLSVSNRAALVVQDVGVSFGVSLPNAGVEADLAKRVGIYVTLFGLAWYKAGELQQFRVTHFQE